MEQLKFAWIVFCFLLSLTVIPFSFSRFFAVHISAALFFTVLADYFILLGGNYFTGLLLFCLVQFCYISLARGFVKLKAVLYSLPPYAAALFFVRVDPLIMAAGLYAVLFFMNLRLSLRALANLNKANGALYIAGLILFALCDINVFIFNLKNYVDSVENLAAFAVLLIWVFYMPAQFILAVSGLDFSHFHKKLRG